MTPETGHPRAELHELLDDRLDGEARARIERHLDTCPACRLERDTLLRLREGLREAVRATAAPPELADRVRAALDAEDSATPMHGSERRRRSRRAVLTIGAVAASAILFVVLFDGRGSSLPSTVARDFTRYQAGDLTLEVTSSSAEAIQAFFEARVTFAPRVFDLGMMGYTLVGGRLHDLTGRPSALFVYRNGLGRALICQMFPGRTEELSGATELRDQNGIRFHIYRQNGQTLVFWQEAGVVCVLVSDLPAEDVIQLAFTKAMKPNAATGADGITPAAR